MPRAARAAELLPQRGDRKPKEIVQWSPALLCSVKSCSSAAALQEGCPKLLVELETPPPPTL